MTIAAIVISIVVIIISLTFHEFAHAWVANRLGDPTAKNLGRMSINPLVHIDPIGTILFPLILSMTGLGVFGWAKPVPVNPGNLRNRRRDDALISVAGPGANLILAIIGSLLTRLTLTMGVQSDGIAYIIYILLILVKINIFLMLFNLLPITPLDGSGVIQFFLSPRALFSYQQLSRKLMFVFLIVLLMTDWIFLFYLKPVGDLFLFVLQYLAGIQLIR